MRNLASVSEFAENYDGFILDIWGVIHDGVEAYSGVVECLQELNQRNKKIIFLSNAPRRASKVKKVLAKFGITENLYYEALSSGEISFEIIKNQLPRIKNYFYIGPPKDRDLLAGLGLNETTAENADIAIATGFDEDNSTLDEKLPDLKSALSKNLTLYCVNPDKIVVRQNGSSMLCAGVMGEYYTQNGGKVEFIGKPYAAVYTKCFELFGATPKARIAAIGDNLDTDILGANNAGIDSVLCLGGVLKAERKPYLEIIESSKIYPKITIPKFNW